MTPDFSIIVPVYNSEQYLEKCINAVLSQGDYNYELILVNDGSPDRDPGPTRHAKYNQLHSRPRPDRDPSLQLQGQQSQQIQGTVRRREDRRFLHRFL